MLETLGTLAAAQIKATTSTMAAALRLLDYVYAATHRDATIRYSAIDKILHV
jgi:hypothetical protein